MKPPLLLPLLLASCAMSATTAPSAETTTAPVTITGSLDERLPLPAAPSLAPARPAFTILASVRQPLGARAITLHRIADPGLPAPATSNASDEAPAATDTAAVPIIAASMAPLEAPDAEVDMAPALFLQATVVDHRATLLGWWHEGREYRAWSNVDFSHLTGFNEFRRGDRHFFAIMAVTEVESATEPALRVPADLPAGAPAFRLIDTTGSASRADAAACETVVALHELYASQGDRLRQAHAARERAQQLREALAATTPPPPPSDVVVHYWKVQPVGGGQ